MCGWPAGMGYPPAEGELAQASAPGASDTSPAAADEAEDVGVQLDALAGMVARQGQALSPVDDVTPPEPATSEVVVADEPAEVSQPEASQPESRTPDSAVEADIDPLTAPLDAVTGAAIEPEADLPRISEPADVEPTSKTPIDEVEPTTSDEPEPEPTADADADAPITGTAGRSAALIRPTQLLIVATAVLNLILVGINAVLVTPSGSMTFVVLGVALITLAVWTAAAVTFLHWVSRAHAHVAAASASRQRHGASMSLLGWFIPIAGFVIGYRVLQDLWTGSNPATRDQADAAPAKVRTIDIWLLGVVTAALFGYAMPLTLGESALWAGLSALGWMVAALSLATTLGTISTWQLDSDVEAEEISTSELTASSRSDNAETLPVQTAPAPEPVTVAAE